MNYSNDERNPRVRLTVGYQAASGVKERELMMRKAMVADLFATLEKIQDHINTYQ